MRGAAFIEAAVGAIDGQNRVFSVSTWYVPGSVQVFINGFVVRKDWADGFDELGRDKIRMKQAPKAGDDVRIYFRPS